MHTGCAGWVYRDWGNSSSYGNGDPQQIVIKGPNCFHFNFHIDRVVQICQVTNHTCDLFLYTQCWNLSTICSLLQYCLIQSHLSSEGLMSLKDHNRNQISIERSFIWFLHWFSGYRPSSIHTLYSYKGGTFCCF